MIDIIIVNWNSGNLLAKCINSVFTKANEQFLNKIIIIDNNSADDSANNILPNNKIELIRNNENLGFSKACNQGFRLSQALYVLLLNPDAMLLENTLSDCILFMGKNEAVDILGCALLDDNDNLTKTCSRFPTPARFFFDASGLSKIAPFIFKPGTVMTDWNHGKSCYVDQVMGAFMFIRRNIFNKIGFFDEQFFVYYEELDFSKRLADAGGKTYYNRDIKAIHTGEGTTASVKGFRLFLNLQSRLKYAKKHFSKLGYLLVFISTYSIEYITRLIYLLILRRFREIKDLSVAFKLLFHLKPGSSNSIPHN